MTFVESQTSETSPLLSQREAEQQSLVHHEEHGTFPDIKTGDSVFRESLSTTRLFEAKLVTRSSAPLIVSYVLQYSLNVTTTVVSGHLGTAELGAMSLAAMLTNVTGLAVYEGLATSLDTLCSQAYGGRDRKMVGLHLQRMVYFLWLVSIPIAAVWICSPWILQALVPEKEVARLAGTYMRMFLIGAPGAATFEAGKRFVQAQGYFNPSLYVLLIAAPFNVFLNWIFVFKFGWGLAGAGAAVSVTNLMLPVMLLAYVYFIIPSTLQCWPGFSKDAFRNWGPMVRLAIPGVIMIQGEWLAYDILTFTSAYLGRAELAAQSVLFNVAILCYHIPFPASVAVSTRLGNLIGCGALKAARIAVTTYYLIFVAIGFFNMVLLISLKDVIPTIFNADANVRQAFSTVLPIVAAAQLSDSTTALCNGILRGLGRQKIGGWVNILVYYLFCIPASLFLTFGPPRLGLFGLWVGPICGTAAVTVIITIFIWRISWQKCVDEARGRSS